MKSSFKRCNVSLPSYLLLDMNFLSDFILFPTVLQNVRAGLLITESMDRILDDRLWLAGGRLRSSGHREEDDQVHRGNLLHTRLRHLHLRGLCQADRHLQNAPTPRWIPARGREQHRDVSVSVLLTCCAVLLRVGFDYETTAIFKPAFFNISTPFYVCLDKSPVEVPRVFMRCFLVLGIVLHDFQTMNKKITEEILVILLRGHRKMPEWECDTFKNADLSSSCRNCVTGPPC